MARVENILSQKMFSNDGPLVKQLESLVAEQLGVAHVVAVSNATVGLELVLETLPKKGEVILPSFTFVATAHAVKRTGFTPVFCDVTSEHGLLDPQEVQRLVTPNTVALLPVNVYGNVCDVASLADIAARHNLKLIFDSAHALGVRHNGQYVGAFGDAEVFSLHATKFINGFEGGLITTNNDALARKLRLGRNFGFVEYDEVDCVGTNAKLSEIHAAMALTNFYHFADIVEINRRNYVRYQKKLPSWLELVEFPEGTESNYQYVVGRCPPHMRDGLVQHLHSNQILARRYFYPGLHRMKPYFDPNHSLPITEALADSVLCLPTGQDVSEAIVDHIADLIQQFGDHSNV